MFVVWSIRDNYLAGDVKDEIQMVEIYVRVYLIHFISLFNVVNRSLGTMLIQTIGASIVL